MVCRRFTFNSPYRIYRLEQLDGRVLDSEIQWCVDFFLAEFMDYTLEIDAFGL